MVAVGIDFSRHRAEDHNIGIRIQEFNLARKAIRIRHVVGIHAREIRADGIRRQFVHCRGEAAARRRGKNFDAMVVDRVRPHPFT
jgi:hypothetical protein